MWLAGLSYLERRKGREASLSPEASGGGYFNTPTREGILSINNLIHFEKIGSFSACLKLSGEEGREGNDSDSFLSSPVCVEGGGGISGVSLSYKCVMPIFS